MVLLYFAYFLNYSAQILISLKPIHCYDKVKLILYPRVRNSTTHLTLKYIIKVYLFFGVLGDKLQINMAEKYLRECEKLAWKRPISRTYEFNLQLGESYYSPQTLYLDQKSSSYGQKIEPPGALTMR